VIICMHSDNLNNYRTTDEIFGYCLIVSWLLTLSIIGVMIQTYTMMETTIVLGTRELSGVVLQCVPRVTSDSLDTEPLWIIRVSLWREIIYTWAKSPDREKVCHTGWDPPTERNNVYIWELCIYIILAGIPSTPTPWYFHIGIDFKIRYSVLYGV